MKLDMFLKIFDCLKPDVSRYSIKAEVGNIVYSFNLLVSDRELARQIKEFQRELQEAGYKKQERSRIMGTVGNILDFFRKNMVFVRTCRELEIEIKPPYSLVLTKLRYIQFLNKLDCGMCEVHCQPAARYYECLEECYQFCKQNVSSQSLNNPPVSTY